MPLIEVLNRDKPLTKMLRRFLRARYHAGSQLVTTGSGLELVPGVPEASLRVRTAPRSSMGKSSSHFDTSLFLAIADSIEALIGAQEQNPTPSS